jgi:hypothetical protein
MGVIAQDSESTPLAWNMITMDPDSIGQGTWTRGTNSLYPYNGNLTNATAQADGDNYSINFRCRAGTYTFRMNAHRTSTAPILDVDIDGDEKGSIDLYFAAGDLDYVAEITGITISAGSHTLRIRVDGKNGSSGGYYLRTHGMYLQKTA